MVKLNQRQHITRRGVIKRNPYGKTFFSDKTRYEEFKLPNMVLMRADVENAIGKTKADKMSNDKMQELANKIAKQLSQEWDVLIRDILDDWNNYR